jgi:hypothetical protein
MAEFCDFFLRACLDQVEFMGDLLQPSEMLRRMEIWSEEEIRAKRIPRGSWPLLREAVVAGEFARGQASQLTGYEVRQARTVLNTLIAAGYLASPGPLRRRKYLGRLSTIAAQSRRNFPANPPTRHGLFTAACRGWASGT